MTRSCDGERSHRRFSSTRPDRAAANPLGHRLDVVGLQLGPATRHPREAVGVLQDFEQRALLRVAGDDDRTGLTAAQQAFARIDAEAGHRRFAVTGVAVGGEQRPDAGLEKLDALRERRGLRGGGGWRRRLAGARKGTHQRQQSQDHQTDTNDGATQPRSASGP